MGKKHGRGEAGEGAPRGSREIASTAIRARSRNADRERGRLARFATRGRRREARAPRPFPEAVGISCPIPRAKAADGHRTRRVGRARTSGKKQLNPSRRSGCPPRRYLTLRTTSGVSDLRASSRAGRQKRVGEAREGRRNSSAENATERRAAFHVPRVLEVAHDLEERLVHLRVRSQEPRLDRPDVRQGVLGRFPVRRHRRGHLAGSDGISSARSDAQPVFTAQVVRTPARKRDARGGCAPRENLEVRRVRLHERRSR